MKESIKKIAIAVAITLFVTVAIPVISALCGMSSIFAVDFNGIYGNNTLTAFAAEQVNDEYTMTTARTFSKNNDFLLLATNIDDVTAYKEVGYEVSVDGAEATKEGSDKFYESITVKTDGEGGTHKFEITDIFPNAVADGMIVDEIAYDATKAYTVKAYMITNDEQTIYGAEKTFEATPVVPAYTRVDKDGVESETGAYILFGSYPQTKVADETVTTALTAEAGALPTAENAQNWTSYGYYQGNGTGSGISNETAYMWYQDVSYENEEYRGVYFTSYRPTSTKNPSSAANSKQDDNGYFVSDDTTKNVYWFKYEPIKWTIMKEESGYATVLCSMAIDSREYFYGERNGEFVAGNYKESSIRAWLNDNFYQTAFGALEQAIIQTVTVDNSAATTDSATNKYACENTEDKVWLFSYQEVAAMVMAADGGSFPGNELGCGQHGATVLFTRYRVATDYAKCQGISVSSSKVNWWERSSTGSHSMKAGCSNTLGHAGSSAFTTETGYGVVPALQIKL